MSSTLFEATRRTRSRAGHLVCLHEVGIEEQDEASPFGLQSFPRCIPLVFLDAPPALSRVPSPLLHHLGRPLHRHTALQQVDTHDERRPTPVPQLHATLEAFQRPGNDPDAISGPDPRHRTRPVTRADQAADRFHLLVRNRVQRIPALADDPDDTVGAGDPDVPFAREREAEEDVAREERPREDFAPIAPPAGDPHARQEDLEAPALETLLHLGLALVPRPHGVPALARSGSGRSELWRDAAGAHGMTSASPGGLGGGSALATFSIPIDSRRASTSVTPS